MVYGGEKESSNLCPCCDSADHCFHHLHWDTLEGVSLKYKANQVHAQHHNTHIQQLMSSLLWTWKITRLVWWDKKNTHTHTYIFMKQLVCFSLVRGNSIIRVSVDSFSTEMQNISQNSYSYEKKIFFFRVSHIVQFEDNLRKVLFRAGLIFSIKCQVVGLHTTIDKSVHSFRIQCTNVWLQVISVMF